MSLLTLAVLLAIMWLASSVWDVVVIVFKLWLLYILTVLFLVLLILG